MGYALITGATSGIGEALVKEFATRGHELILVGRNEQKLKNMKKMLMKMYPGQEVVFCNQDLAVKEGVFELYQWIEAQSLNVEILVNNAGIGYVGEFSNCSPQRLAEMLQVNMQSLTELTAYILPQMQAKKEGCIINIASTGGYHPGAYTAVYYATKAYVLSLSEALYKEMKPYGVKVLSVCPGATATSFSKVAGRKEAGFAMPSEVVARCIYKGMKKGKRVIIPGIHNKLFARLPRGIAAFFVALYQKRLKE